MIEQLKTIREALNECPNNVVKAHIALAQLEAMVVKQEPVPECRYPDCECPAKSACLQDLPVLQTKAVPLQVLYYSMPTSCGKTNWTASLVTKGRGYFNLARSEYPQHVRYQADYVRWLIGELDMMPYLPDYNTHEQTPCHLCGGVGEVDGKPCKGLKFEGVIHNAAAGAALDDPKQAQAEAVPTIYVSKGQLDNLKPDPEDTSGTYLPVRKSPKGKFTHPLFAAPKQAEPFSHATQLQIAYIKGLGDGAQQAQRPDFTDEWTGYLKDGETPFERFLRERKDLNALTKLYQRALEENERLKAQQPQAEVVRSEQEIVDQTEELAAMLMSWSFNHEAADPSTKMRESNHPFAERSWEMACRVQEFLTATDPENAVAELDGREDEAPQQAEAVPPGCVVDRGFRWDGEKQQHIPQLVIEFEPVPANGPCDAQGWKDRDAVAKMFAAQGEKS